MSDERSDQTESNSITLSRRRALAGIGTIGAAAGLGGLGTFAQFTDDEDVDITFTTGEIDGTIAYSATYNGVRFKEMGEAGDLSDHPHVIEGDDGGAGVGFTLDDVKPGDYGSILFEIDVSSNPAWLVNCLDVGAEVDHIDYPDHIFEDVDQLPDFFGNILGAIADGAGWSQNNLGDLLMVIPFYDEDDTSTFFDSDGPDSTDVLSRYGIGTPGAFWSNEQADGEGDPSPPFGLDVFNPLPFNQAIASSGVNTVLWPNDQAAYLTPTWPDVDTGCFLLHGQMADLSGGESSDNTPDEDVAPLQPGETMYFGYDWHLPWEVGNYAQNVTFDFNIGFSFVQERHSAGSKFPNMYRYDPENAGGD